MVSEYKKAKYYVVSSVRTVCSKNNYTRRISCYRSLCE